MSLDVYLSRPGPQNLEGEATQLIEPLKAGLALLKADPVRFKEFNAKNGWGLYEHFVPFVEKYLEACIANPDADVRVSR